ncbi:hypothetical protein Dimus_017127 [Dionaea muscipula]
MAHDKFILCVFLVLFFTQAIQFAYGRNLAVRRTEEFTRLLIQKVQKQKTIALNKISTGDSAKQGQFNNSIESTSFNQALDESHSTPSMDTIDGFMPTSPGRSPGIGHAH